MEKDKLKELILEHKERFLSRQGLVAREVQADTVRYLPQKEIVLITGVRRGGKSSLMRLVCDDVMKKGDVPAANLLYVNFEDERFVDFTVKDFELLYETYLETEAPKGRKYFFLDELQNIKGWEKWVNRLYEFEDVKIFVTGSNAAMLSSEVSTALTGRNRQIRNWPFSFREFLAFKGFRVDEKAFLQRERRAELKRSFAHYLQAGGFPEVLKIDDPTLLEQYFKDIIYRDVIARYSIRNIREIKELALYLASNAGTVQSYKNIKGLIGVKSLSTVRSYLQALEDVFLFFSVDLFDYSVKRQIYNPSKIYCVDTALSRSISFAFSRNLGRVYENMVFLELLRRNEEVYYWKSAKGREVDFIVKKGHRIDKAVQVTLSLSDRKVKERELLGLRDAEEELKPAQLVVLTEDEEGKEMVDGVEVTVVPVYKWLLVKP